jgi:hypothetical protein
MDTRVRYFALRRHCRAKTPATPDAMSNTDAGSGVGARALVSNT